ncbi:MAG: transglutaminase-like domain-containing protein [Methanobacteriaceae archaeon]|nr:transglutaminase-like domain-containing protein [Candidatus Methanorudis spinitermitis]
MTYIDNTNFDKVKNLNNASNINNNFNHFVVGGNSSSVSSNGLIISESSSFISSNSFAAGEYKPSKLSQSSIVAASLKISKYISMYGKLPDYVEISAYKFSMSEYLYLASKTIQYQYMKIDSEIKIKYNVKNPKKPIGTNVKMEISSNSYYKYGLRIANFISKYSIAPNYLNLGSTKIQYQTLIYIFAETLSWTKPNGNNLASTLFFNVKKNSKVNKHMPTYTVASKSKTVSSKKLNIDYNGEPLKEYLLASKSCQVNDKKIKLLSYQITKKYKNTYDKAKAIYNWVRDKVRYSFYYNTKYGSKKTMTKKVGNCVDQSHLIVALSRASGIASRYVHGTCDFISGNTYGHVWTQIKVGNTWYVADPTSSKNSFGAVKNWNTNSYNLNGIYSFLNF